jgi:hypothetical protein
MVPPNERGNLTSDRDSEPVSDTVGNLTSFGNSEQINPDLNDDTEERVVVNIDDVDERVVVNMLPLNTVGEMTNAPIVTAVELASNNNTNMIIGCQVRIANLEEVLMENENIFEELGDNASSSGGDTCTSDEAVEEPIEYDLQKVVLETDVISSAPRPNDCAGIKETVHVHKKADPAEVAATIAEDVEVKAVYNPITNTVNEDLVIQKTGCDEFLEEFKFRQPKGFKRKSIIQLMREFGNDDTIDTITPSKDYDFLYKAPQENWINVQMKYMRERLQIKGNKYITIAVQGDGHCGFHCLAMGLDYLGLFRSITRQPFVHLFLRKLLKKHLMCNMKLFLENEDYLHVNGWTKGDMVAASKEFCRMCYLMYDESYDYSYLDKSDDEEGARYTKDEIERFMDVSFCVPAFVHLFMCRVVLIAEAGSDEMLVQEFDGRDPNKLKVNWGMNSHTPEFISGPKTMCLVLCDDHIDLMFPRKKQSTGDIDNRLHPTGEDDTKFVPFAFVCP